jgi:DNA-directed RNA polymerase specialized sigma24 family protein
MWIVMIQGLPSWKGRVPFCHWASVVVKRAAIKWRGLSSTTPPPLPLPPRPPDGGRDLSEVMKCIEETASRFPDRIREVYELKRQEPPLLNKEIAERLGIAIPTVAVRLRIMRELLKPCLER